MTHPADMDIHQLLDRVDQTSEGDNNDDEISALQDALSEALRLAGIDQSDHHKPRRLPKVQIVHGRNPDAECGLTVFVDGQRVDAEVEDIDPGRGYTRSDWDVRLRDAAIAVQENPGDAYRLAVWQELTEAGDSQYITDND